MSSSKKSKLDLLVRVRYRNEVPPPSFPPQLVQIPDDLDRFTRPDWISEYASSIPAPMLVDSEGGMPMDLNRYDGIWTGEMAAINPSGPVPLSELHQSDRVLLEPPSITPISTLTPATQASLAGRVAAGSLKQTLHRPDVSWLRNTTYLQARSGASFGGSAEGRRLGPSRSEELRDQSIPDASMAAQVQAIEKSFWEMENSPLEELKHPDPSKAHLKAVDSFEILPDEDTFATGYTWVIYPERPLDEDRNISDPRLRATILRPQRDANSATKTFMEMFVPRDEEEAMADLRRTMKNPLPEASQRDGVPEDAKPAVYKYLRDYAYDSQEPQLPDGYWIFSLDDGLQHPELEDGVEGPAASPVKADADEDEDEDADLFGEKEDEAEAEIQQASTGDGSGQSNGVNGMNGEVTTDSAAASLGANQVPRRGKGVYYTPVFRKTTVRKRRFAKDELDDKPNRWDAIQVLYEEPSEDVREMIASGNDYIVDAAWASKWLREGESNAETLGEADGLQGGD